MRYSTSPEVSSTEIHKWSWLNWARNSTWINRKTLEMMICLVSDLCSLVTRLRVSTVITSPEGEGERGRGEGEGGRKVMIFM